MTEEHAVEESHDDKVTPSEDTQDAQPETAEPDTRGK